MTVTGPRKDLFGDLAVAKNFLSWTQVRDALQRQVEYKQKGIPLRIGECCLELKLLTQVQINEILAVQRDRRKVSPVTRIANDELDFQNIQDGQNVKLGRYRLDKRLGGAMGIVFRCTDEQTGSIIALKVLPKSLAHDTNFVERFKREVKATCVLSHPNIVHIYDTGVEHGVFYLATEFVEGETLAQKLSRETCFSELEALHVLRDVGKALAHAHARRVLHRDLKPDNVMMAQNGVVKLADFGLAKFLYDDRPLTAEGIAVGTPHYISPEQARALKETDHRSDLYSLGATVFHLITGRLPYEGENGSEVMKRHVFEAVPDPREVRPDLNPSIAELLMRLMAKLPSQRYESADDVVEVVEKIIQSLDPRPPEMLPPPKKTSTTRKPFDG
jgi:serine/threonine-protein kinase